MNCESTNVAIIGRTYIGATICFTSLNLSETDCSTLSIHRFASFAEPSWRVQGYAAAALMSSGQSNLPFAIVAGSQYPLAELCAKGVRPVRARLMIGLRRRFSTMVLFFVRFTALNTMAETALAEPLGKATRPASMEGKTPLYDPARGAELPAFDIVVPVPLHPGRLRTRGFNQAEMIARVMARERDLRVVTSAVVRVRRTRTQTARSLDIASCKNVRDAFRVCRPGSV